MKRSIPRVHKTSTLESVYTFLVKKCKSGLSYPPLSPPLPPYLSFPSSLLPSLPQLSLPLSPLPSPSSSPAIISLFLFPSYHIPFPLFPLPPLLQLSLPFYPLPLSPATTSPLPSPSPIPRAPSHRDDFHNPIHSFFPA